jgi:uncharacterized short protein YbdD (DUF466 family)
MSLTGPYAEDSAAILTGMQDYVKWVNENKILAPWYPDKTIPADVTFKVLYRDDAYTAANMMPIYEELRANGMLVYRCSGTTTVLTLKDRLMADRVGATSMSTSPVIDSPPGTIFANYSIYTDSCAAFADWFMASWKAAGKTTAPKFAYLTADSSMGKGVLTPEMDAYLKNVGFELVGQQLVPVVPTAPPTTQLMWLKDNKVDACFGVMINPGSQPTVKEMNRLDMGPYKTYKITFGCATPSHLQVFVPAMGQDGNGFVVAGGYASWDDTGAGVTFANNLLKANRPDKVGSMHIMYLDGIIEGMTQIEALRLTLASGVPFEELKPVDVLEYGFYKIKDLSTGGITATPLTYAPTQVDGITAARIQQVQNGKIVDLGSYPLRHIYKHE